MTNFVAWHKVHVDHGHALDAAIFIHDPYANASAHACEEDFYNDNVKTTTSLEHAHANHGHALATAVFVEEDQYTNVSV